MYKLHNRPVFGNLLAILAGILLPLSLAPFHQPLLAFISASLLLVTWIKATPSLAAIRGFLYGLGAFGGGVHWVFVAIHRFGGAPLFFAALLTALFIAVLSIYPMLQGYLLTKLFRKPNALKLLIAFPITWVSFDLLRSWVFTGFPWIFIGYSQIDTILKHYAPFGTVYLLSLITVFVSAVIVSPMYLKRWQWMSAFTSVIILFAGAYQLSLSPTKNDKKISINISIIQGNIPQEDKWDPNLIIQTTQKYRNLTDQLWASDLIIWPEAAVPVFQTQAKEYIEQLADTAMKNNSHLIFGIPIVENGDFYNGLIMVGPTSGRYKKRHLVPFGEYTPFEPLSTWVMDQLQIPMSDFKHGPNKQELLEVNSVKIAPFICYEIIYPFLVRQSLPEADMLLVLSDDSWFGDSVAKYQHLQMAQMRAIENNRYVIFSTNTGVTAIIQPNGEIQQQLPEDKSDILTTAIK